MIACLTIPYFAAAVERRHDNYDASPGKGLSNTPKNHGLVLGGKPWEPQEVFAYSREVANQGVQPGMSLRLAHFLSPRAKFQPANKPLYQGSSAEIVDLLSDFTNLVEPELFWSQAGMKANFTGTGLQAGYGPAFGHRLPARYTIDLESLPQKEALRLVAEIGRSVRAETKLAPAIGLADNTFVAHIAAVMAQSNHTRSIPFDHVAGFLSCRSIRFLALDRETSRRLSLLGIRTLGQLVTLPQSSAAIHLGLDEPSRKALAGLKYLITGDSKDVQSSASVAELLPPFKPGNQYENEQLTYSFDPPIGDRLILERVIAQAAIRLANRLQNKNLEGSTLQIILEAQEEVFHEINTGDLSKMSTTGSSKLTRRHPTSDPSQLKLTLRELLHSILTVKQSDHENNAHSFNQGNLTAPDGNLAYFNVGLSNLIIRISDLSAAETQQLHLFDHSKSEGRLENMAATLSKKYNPGTFFNAKLVDCKHPLLERRFDVQEMVPV